MFKYWGKKALTGAMSYEESIFNLGLRRIKKHFRKQYNPLASFTAVDFFIPSLKLCVYVDGVYWHSKQTVKLRDIRQTKILKAAGFRVLRISDLEVRRLGIDGIKKLLIDKYSSVRKVDAANKLGILKADKKEKKEIS